MTRKSFSYGRNKRNENSENQLVRKGKVILQIMNEKIVKGVYSYQDNYANLNNLQTHLLHYLLNLKKMIQTTNEFAKLIGLLVSYALYTMP